MILRLLLFASCLARISNAADTPYEVTAADQATLVDDINKYRAQVATDPKNNVPNMNCVAWDDALVAAAQAEANKCTLAPGEPAAMSFYFFPPSGANYRQVADTWFSEQGSYNGETTYPGQTYKHYTSMVWASADKVGCAATTCDMVKIEGMPIGGGILLACDFASTNVEGQAPFATGTEAGSTCTADRNKPANAEKLCCDDATTTTTSTSTTTTSTTTSSTTTSSTTSSTTTSTTTSSTTTSTSTTTSSTTTTTSTTTSSTTTSTTSTTTTSTTTTSTTTTSTTTTSTTTATTTASTTISSTLTSTTTMSTAGSSTTTAASSTTTGGSSTSTAVSSTPVSSASPATTTAGSTTTGPTGTTPSSAALCCTDAPNTICSSDVCEDKPGFAIYNCPKFCHSCNFSNCADNPSTFCTEQLPKLKSLGVCNNPNFWHECPKSCDRCPTDETNNCFTSTPQPIVTQPPASTMTVVSTTPAPSLAGTCTDRPTGGCLKEACGQLPANDLFDCPFTCAGCDFSNCQDNPGDKCPLLKGTIKANLCRIDNWWKECPKTCDRCPTAPTPTTTGPTQPPFTGPTPEPASPPPSPAPLNCTNDVEKYRGFGIRTECTEEYCLVDPRLANFYCKRNCFKCQDGASSEGCRDSVTVVGNYKPHINPDGTTKLCQLFKKNNLCGASANFFNLCYKSCSDCDGSGAISANG